MIDFSSFKINKFIFKTIYCVLYVTSLIAYTYKHVKWKKKYNFSIISEITLVICFMMNRKYLKNLLQNKK